MARAQPVDDWNQTGNRRNANEWQALRADLVDLLNQVEGQVARSGQSPASQQPQQSSADGGNRRHEALQSVTRAIERFNDKDERSDIRAAIDQIRGRQRNEDLNMSLRGRAQRHLDEYAEAVGNITDRLERIESGLRGRETSMDGMREIAGQVAQLTGVVELLAGAVGETGQVKRLESQIADVAHLIAEGQNAKEPEGLTNRVDALVETLERLTRDDGALSANNKLDEKFDSFSAAHDRNMGAIEQSVRNIYDRIDTIEQGVGLAPGEIDRLFGEMARISQDTAELRNFMESGQDTGNASEAILSRIDALNARIGDIGAGGGNVEGLQSELAGLKETIGATFDAGFSSLEDKVSALLDSKVNELGEKFAAGPAELSLKEIEAQIGKLVDRMDQTGSQLTELSDLYKENAGTASGVDTDSLAEKVARRTSEEVIRQTGKEQKLGESSLSAIEGRISKLIKAKHAQADSDMSGVQSGIRKVDDRLARLERTLNHKSERHVDDLAPEKAALATPAIEETGSGSTAELSATAPQPEPAPEPVSHDQNTFEATHDAALPMAPSDTQSAAVHTEDEYGTVSASTEVQSEPVSPEPEPTAFKADESDTSGEPQKLTGASETDRMDANPLDDAPLFDMGFATIGKNGEKPRYFDDPPIDTSHIAPAETSEAETDVADEGPAAPQAGSHHFDPETVERPVKPHSSFDADDDSASDDGAAASRSTFIEAARRAAQRHNEPLEPQSKSLFKGLLKSLKRRADEKAEARTDVEAEPASEEPLDKKAEAAARKEAKAAEKQAKREERAAAKQAKIDAKAAKKAGLNIERPEAVESDDLHADPEDAYSQEADKESFLSRHRRTILLAATLAAVCILTYDLIAKRQAATQVPSEPSTAAASMIAPEAPANTVTDTTPTGSIGPTLQNADEMARDVLQAPPHLIDNSLMMAEPEDSFETGAIQPDTELEPVISAPELPPEQVGPMLLRQAAADGDPRAQFEVAAIYSEGQALEKDLAKAAEWYRFAAEQDFAPAAFRLGGLYEAGKGVERDLDKARQWYEKAAEAGNRMAMHNLAALYAGGEMGNQEFGKASAWFRKAAELGLADSQFNLGMLNARGLGIPQDMSESFKWFSLAAARGDDDAAKARDEVARSLDVETVSRLQGEISSWQPGQMDIRANFAPIGTWSQDFNPGQDIVDRGIVEKVQIALNRLGYDVGVPDGIMGPRTREAIKDFERTTGMTESGSVNPRLLAVLGSQPV